MKKNVKETKVSYPLSFICFLYALLGLKMVLFRCVATFSTVPYQKLDTEWLSSILTNFLLMFTASL